MKDTSANFGSRYKYWAFISYSGKDKKWGEWLINKIENYRIPRSLVGLKTGCGAIPARIYPVFRDRDELRASQDVANALKAALDLSHYLIVVCSPNSADPESWVNKEIIEFKSMGRDSGVIAMIVAGEPFASERPGSESKECFPAALRHKLDTKGQLTTERVEPLAADVTRENDNPRVSRRKALLKVIARMIDVDFDTLAQRDRRRRRQKMAAWSAAGLSLLIAFGWLTALWVNTTRISTSQELAKQSLEKIQTEKDLGALLGVYAYYMYPTPAAYDALLTTVSENPNLVTFLRRGIDVSSIALSPDNRLVAVADCVNTECVGRDIYLYELATRRQAIDPLHVNAKNISEMVFNPEGSRLLVVTNDGEFHQLLELDTSRPDSPGVTLYRDRQPISNISMSDDNRFYSVALRGGEFKIFDRKAGGRKCGDIIEGNETKFAFSPDGTLFAVASGVRHQMRLIEMQSCESVQWWIPDDRVAALAFTSNGERLITIMPDGTVTEWSVASRKQIDRYSVTKYTLNGYLHTFSHDAALLASKHGNEIRVFDLAKRRRLHEMLQDEFLGRIQMNQIKDEMQQLQIASLQGHMGSPRLFVISGDGTTLVSVDDQQVVIPWTIKGSPFVENLEDGSPYEVSDKNATEATSADNRLRAKVSEETEGCTGDYTWNCKRWIKLTLFDASTNLQIKTLVTGGDSSPALESPWVEFYGEGEVIVGRGTSQQLWHIDSKSLVERACRMANRSLTTAELQEYLGWRQWLATGKLTPNCKLTTNPRSSNKRIW
jgi:WD40 repeat protein